MRLRRWFMAILWLILLGPMLLRLERCAGSVIRAIRTWRLPAISLHGVGLSESSVDMVEPSDEPRDDTRIGLRQRLDTLVQEHQRVSLEATSQLSMVIQTVSIGYAAIAALVVVIVSEKLPIPASVYGLLPFVTVFVFSLVLLLFFRSTYASYYLRDVERAIAEMTDLPLLRYEWAAVRGLQSPRTGNPAYLTSYALLLISAAVLHLILLIFCWRGLDQIADVWRIGFLLTHGFIALALLWLLIGSWLGLEQTYQKWIAWPMDVPYRDPRRIQLLHLGWYAVAPAKFVGVLKGVITFSIFVATALILAPDSRESVYSTTFWEMRFGFSKLWIDFLLVYVCVELLAKQTTYVWNDWWDIEKDQTHSRKRTAKLAAVGSRSDRKRIFWARALLTGVVTVIVAVSAGFLPWLPLLVFFIFAWQALYDRWAKEPLKPQMQLSDPRRLVVAALGYAERAVAAGIVVLANSKWSDWPVLLITSAWTVSFAFLFLGSYWDAEYWSEGWLDRWMVRHAQTAELLGTIGMICFGFLAGVVYSENAFFDDRRAVVGSFMLTILAVGAIAVVYHQGEIQQCQQCQGLHSPKRQSLRLPIVVVILLSMGIVYWIWSDLTGYIALGAILPVVLFAAYYRLTYEEITFWQYDLGPAMRALPFKLDGMLFPDMPRDEMVSRPSPPDQGN